MMKQSLVLLAALTMAFHPIAPALVPPQGYVISDLGTQLGHTLIYPFDINDKGQVAGYTTNTPSTIRRGFLIGPPYDSMTTLNTWRNNAFAIARALNNSGVVVGAAVPSGGDELGVLWSHGAIAIIPPFTGDTSSFAHDINSNGAIVGQSDDNGFLQQSGNHFPMPPLANFDFATVTAINDTNTIVGFCTNLSAVDKATIWSAAMPTALPDLGGTHSRANDVANNGMIVGAATLPAGGNYHAYMIPPGQSPVNLDTLNGQRSEATATNGDAVVGFVQLPTDDFHAFIYRNNDMVDLNDLIPPGSGWVLAGASGINRYGQICGSGKKDGVDAAFVLTPYPPTGGAADWDFTIDERGWTAATNIPPFEPAEAMHVPGTGFGIRATNFPCFAFLQSPELTLVAGRTYRLWCTISTTATTAEAAPQFRLRAFQTSTNMSELLALDSIGDALPTADAKTFEYTITTQLTEAQQTYRFALDYTFFNPLDEGDAWVYLQRVVLAED